MKYNNPKHLIYSPLVLAFVLLAGVMIGILIKKSPKVERSIIFSQKDKLGVVLDLIEENYVEDISKKGLIEKAIPIVLQELDPHSIYIPPADLKKTQEPLEGNFDGIGVQFNIHKDTILVINVIEGGPSSKVGLLSGDRIVKINDSIFAGKKISSKDVIKNLKGPSGTKVKVGIKRSGYNKLLDFEIKRGKIPIYSIDVAYMVDEEVGYLKISRFGRTTYREFLESIYKLKKQGLTKLIVDLRRNSGGYLTAATSIADEFLPGNKMIVYTKGEHRKAESYMSTRRYRCANIDVAFLIDMYSASASEILTGAIQDHDAGIIIGQRTFGKGLVQESIFFKDSSAIRLTIARYYTPSGRCIQKSYKKGIPDYHNDLIKRMENGEFQQADSTHFIDSLKHFTSKGRVVYGGGGIMPDIFIPIDTLVITKFFTQIVRKGLIYKFAVEYSDKNRKRLSNFKNHEDFTADFKKQKIFNKFLKYASKNGVKAKNKEIKISSKEISNRITAYIARNIIDNEGFYPIINANDSAYKKAIDVLHKGWSF